MAGAAEGPASTSTSATTPQHGKWHRREQLSRWQPSAHVNGTETQVLYGPARTASQVDDGHACRRCRPPVLRPCGPRCLVVGQRCYESPMPRKIGEGEAQIAVLSRAGHLHLREEPDGSVDLAVPRNVQIKLCHGKSHLSRRRDDGPCLLIYREVPPLLHEVSGAFKSPQARQCATPRVTEWGETVAMRTIERVALANLSWRGGGRVYH